MMQAALFRSGVEEKILHQLEVFSHRKYLDLSCASIACNTRPWRLCVTIQCPDLLGINLVTTLNYGMILLRF